MDILNTIDIGTFSAEKAIACFSAVRGAREDMYGAIAMRIWLNAIQTVDGGARGHVLVESILGKLRAASDAIAQVAGDLGDVQADADKEQVLKVLLQTVLKLNRASTTKPAEIACTTAFALISMKSKGKSVSEAAMDALLANAEAEIGSQSAEPDSAEENSEDLAAETNAPDDLSCQESEIKIESEANTPKEKKVSVFSMTDRFPKSYRVGLPDVKDIFKEGFLEATEKVDGSQIGFGIVDGELVIRGREQRINPDCPPEVFELAAKHIVSIADKLTPGAFYYGEAVQKRRHNKLRYDRTPRGNIVLFGAMYPTIGEDGKQTLMFLREHKDLEAVANILEVDVAPLLFSGVGCTMEFLESLLEHDSFLGGCKIEGVVIKNYGDGTRDGMQVAKLVSDKFKEFNKPKAKKKQTSAVEKTEELFAGYATEARWEKAVQHLAERGELKAEMADIGKLIKEVNIDTLEEEEAVIKDALWAIWRKEFLRGLTGGLAKWYEHKLSNQGYSDEEIAETMRREEAEGYAQMERDAKLEEE